MNKIKFVCSKLFPFIDLRSAITFLTVGGISAAINFVSFAILWKYNHIDYKVSVTVAYILSVIFHFVANRRYTFKSHGNNLWGHLKKYIVMIIINYLITMFIMYIVTESLLLSPYYGIVLSIGATVGIGYFLAKFWVFV